MESFGAGFWDERFRLGPAVFGDAPDPFLAEQAATLADGATVLVPGDGEGRNGVWLARQGFRVTTVDLSPVGIGQARSRAEVASVPLETVVADLTSWAWPTDAFDCVAAIFLHMPEDARPALHASMLAAARPGGVVLVRAFTPAQRAVRAAERGRGGPPDLALLYDAAMLRGDFSGATVEYLIEHEVTLPEARLHGGVGAVVDGRFRRAA